MIQIFRKHGLFVAAVALQVVILVAMPMRSLYTLNTGREIALKLAPVDPFDMWSGYFVTLRYDISRPDSLANWATFQEGDVVNVVLEKEASNDLWKAVALTKTIPTGKTFIQGTITKGELKFGIEAFYMPEARRDEIQNKINESQGETKIIIALDSDGHAAIKRLVVKNTPYEF
jgi:uncharacterized membrane-anchored protein